MKKIVVKEIGPILREGIVLLLKNPFLFLPKLLIALFYGAGTLFASSLVRDLFSFKDFSQQQLLAFDFSNFFFLSIALIIFSLFSFFLDLLFNGMYPVLVRLALEKKLSFSKFVYLFKPKIGRILLAGILLGFIVMVFSLIQSIIVIYFNLSDFSFILSLIIIFLFGFIFYFIYPKIVFENNSFLKSFSSTIWASFENKKAVFFLSLIPFLVSIVKFVLAYFSEDFLVLVVFWILVLLTGIIYSVHSVVNQIAYEKILLKNNFKNKQRK